jgi:hypothetical protein
MICKSGCCCCKVTCSRENPVLRLLKSSGDRQRGDERYRCSSVGLSEENMQSRRLVKHQSNDNRSTDEGSDSRVKEVGERCDGRVVISPLFELD